MPSRLPDQPVRIRAIGNGCRLALTNPFIPKEQDARYPDMKGAVRLGTFVNLAPVLSRILAMLY